MPSTVKREKLNVKREPSTINHQPSTNNYFPEQRTTNIHQPSVVLKSEIPSTYIASSTKATAMAPYFSEILDDM